MKSVTDVRQTHKTETDSKCNELSADDDAGIGSLEICLVLETVSRRSFSVLVLVLRPNFLVLVYGLEKIFGTSVLQLQ